MSYRNKVSIPNEFVLVISGMPGVGKSTLALNLIKRYSEFRSLNQMNLLRFATRYFNNITENDSILQEGLRFQNHDEAKLHMKQLVPVLRSFIKRQLDKKIPTIIEGIDLYHPHLIFEWNVDYLSNKVLLLNLYCSEESLHYSRLKAREKYRQNDTSNIDDFFDNIRLRNDLLHHDIVKINNPNMKSFDVSRMNKEKVLETTEKLIKGIAIGT